MGKVLHASYSGYFPFCIGTADQSKIGKYKPYPISMSLDDIMKAFWRVKTWRVKGLLLDSIATPQYLDRDGDFIEITKEEELVCAVGFGFVITKDDEDGYPDRAEFYLWKVNETSTVIKKNNSFYPRILFGFEYFTLSGSNEIASSELDWNTSPSTEDAGTIKFMNYEISGFKITGNTSYVGGSITPEEYWSYGGTYNTSTGQRL